MLKDPFRILLLVADSRRGEIAKALMEDGADVDPATGLADARLRVRRARPHAALVETGGTFDEGALRAIAKEDPTLPLIATGPARGDVILGALRAGARDYLAEGTAIPGEWIERLRRASIGSLLETHFGAAGDAVLAAIREAEASRETEEETRRALADRTSAFRELEEVYRHDLERMLMVFESVSDGLVFADRAGVVVLMNPAAASIVGCAPLESVGRRIDEIGEERKLRETLAEECKRALGGGPRERLFLAGGQRRVLVRTLPTPAGSEEPAGTLSLLRDVTAQVRTNLGHRASLRRLARRLRRLAARLATGSGKRASEVARALEEEAVTLANSAQHHASPSPGEVRVRTTRRRAGPVSSLP